MWGSAAGLRKEGGWEGWKWRGVKERRPLDHACMYACMCVCVCVLGEGGLNSSI